MSKALSFVLLHEAAEVGLSFDDKNYVSANALLDYLKTKPEYNINTLSDLKEIIRYDDKKNFSMKQINEMWFIRENHSPLSLINVVKSDVLTLIEDYNSYPELIHCTFKDVIYDILKKGLSIMSRNYIYFAENKEICLNTHNNANIFIYIDVQKAIKDGIKFYLSINNTIMSPGNENGYIEPKYFKSVINSEGNDLLKKDPNIPCAGCIVFREFNNELQVCLIRTHGNICNFPGEHKMMNETLIECATRRLKRETGILIEDIEYLRGSRCVDDSSSIIVNNQCYIYTRLYVTKYVSNIDKLLVPEFIFDVADIAFVSIEEAMTLLAINKQIVLSKAIELLQQFDKCENLE